MEVSKWGCLAVLAGTLVAGLMSTSTGIAQDTGRSNVKKSFYADRRAHGIGDVLTVLVVETASVTASARTRTGKDESATASLSPSANDTRSVGAGFESDFSGGGQIERSGKLFARLAVVVDRVDSNGNLSVSGEQSIVVNNEHQNIRLAGIIRPEDIGPDNTIPSWRVSGARIELSGNGVLAQRQSPGWLTRLLTWFGQ